MAQHPLPHGALARYYTAMHQLNPKREKRSLSLYGHRTSVALETPFWAVIDDYAREHDLSLAGLLARIDDERIAAKSTLGLAAYLRVWALRQVQNQLPTNQ